jgi:prepilin-type N-terminal cleavage/methylation domain-containing protein
MFKQQGITLIEVIAVLIILGLVATAGTLGFVTAMRGYVFATDNIDLAQKAQIVLNRMNIELSHILYNPPVGHPLHDASKSEGFVVTGNRNEITYDANFGVTRPIEAGNTIAFANNELTLNGFLLCDDVTAFSFDYFSTATEASPSASGVFAANTLAIGVNLTLTGVNNVPVTFQTTIMPKFEY